MKFNTKEELLAQLEKDNACEAGYRWAESQNSLEDIFKNVKDDWRFWCLIRGYEQFAEDCDWGKFSGFECLCILKRQPQFEKYRSTKN